MVGQSTGLILGLIRFGTFFFALTRRGGTRLSEDTEGDLDDGPFRLRSVLNSKGDGFVLIILGAAVGFTGLNVGKDSPFDMFVTIKFNRKDNGQRASGPRSRFFFSYRMPPIHPVKTW